MTIDWLPLTNRLCSSIGNEHCFVDKQGKAIQINIAENKVISFSL